ncbi:hypothetical protein AB0M31_35030 [Streptomyces sp. NPDC051773]|uniref:hypothetical protein n=1 Tax=Streptomyces sp. NPDC051773 TaxID=3156682 RepID=UPI00341A1B77
MRKFTVTAAVLGLAALGLAVPTTAAQAADDIVVGPGCDSKWGPRDGRIYAWDGPDCENDSYGRGHACLLPGEMYADDLAHSRFSNGAPVDNNISSHRWANSSSCVVILT